MLIGVLLAMAAVCQAAQAAPGQYGQLIARGKASSVSAAKASFHRVRPPRVFWLVVTDPAKTQLSVSWSIDCSNPAHRRHGGAAGQANVAHGRWVKRIRADWITRPAFCSGSVGGSAVSGPVQIHIYAN